LEVGEIGEMLPDGGGEGEEEQGDGEGEKGEGEKQMPFGNDRKKSKGGFSGDGLRGRRRPMSQR
jgi:hypothetical protein